MVGDCLIVYHDRVKFLPYHLFPSNSGNPEEEFVRLGQVQSHATGNTSNPMQATAGGNINYINYYGSQSNAAWNPSQMTMDPEKFTKPIADTAVAMAGPALKSPTVEECGYSDRIMQITAGKSAITSQEAVNAVVGYGRWPDYYDGAAEAIDLPTRPGVACDRFYTFDSFSWTKTSKAWLIHLPDALAEFGVFGQNLNYHYLYRSGFCVHVQCNASKFHQGALIVAAIPEMVMPTNTDATGVVEIRDWAKWPKEWPIGQTTLAPHQLINLRTNNSATIIYPFTNPAPASFGLSHNHVTIAIIVMVPLDYSSGASTNIPITVSIAPMSSQFSGLRNSLQTQGLPTFDVPGSGMFSSVLRNSGYPLYPEFNATHGFKNPGRVTNLLEVAQIGTFVGMTRGQSGFTYTIDLNNQQTTTALFNWDMSFLYDAFQSTYLCRLARLFNSYRGSIVFEFTFCGSAMATGKLLLSYTPPGGNAPTTRRDAMLGTHLIWDIGLQSTAKFTVPYISTTQFRYGPIDNNILSLDGFISCFYQTTIVVPPGTPTTCQLICKMSAGTNFVFRVPCDDAYFQGLGDKIEGMIQETVQTALQNVEVPAITPGTEPGLSITSGDAAALTAAETGASASTDGSTTMEVRQADITFSAAETDVEYVYSRYFSIGEFGVWSGHNFNYYVVDLNRTFWPTQGGNTSLRTKMKMFTYLKFDLDIVLIPALPSVPVGDTYQFLFVPYGSSLPADGRSALWDTTANPIITWTVGNPPPSMRIPFISVASCFAPCYNGYSKFGEHLATDYGFFPGNYFGTLFVRKVVPPTTGIHNFKICMRPVNVEAYMPRPIVSYKTNQKVSPKSRYRLRYIDGDEAEPLGVRSWHPGVAAVDWRCPVDDWEEKIQLCCYPVETISGPFTMWRLKKNVFILPGHAKPQSGEVLIYGPTSPYADWASVDPIKTTPSKWQEVPGEDLILCEFPDMPKGPGISKYLVSDAPQEIHRILRVTINSSAYQNMMGDVDSYTAKHPSYRCAGVYQWNAYAAQMQVEHGYCGGLLHEQGKVYGILVAGLPQRNLALFSILTKGMFDKHGFLKQCPQISPGALSPCPASPLGPVEWLNGTFEDLGTTFGAAFSAEVREQVKPVLAQAEQLVKGKVAESFTGTILKMIVKVVCGVAIMMNSYDKGTTLMALTTMLGIDLITTDPFQWMKEQVSSLFYGRVVTPQGPTEWLKEFTVACNAAKGLEWVVNKISHFFDWLAQFFKREDKMHSKFLKLMDQWPEIMVQMDVAEMTPAAITDYGKQKLCEKVLMLKTLCDSYGVERNFATGQVVRYAAKARKMISSMRQSRHEPVALCIHGGPGTGKSLATEIIGRALARKHDNQMPYSLPPDPKHFDGYTQQDVVLMDDIGQNPDGEDLALFCQMVSSTNFIPPMADLESKGQPFTSKFVLCSSNMETLKPPTIAEPKALQRRFFLDLDIVNSKDYTRYGRLDLEQATVPCTGCPKPEHFRECQPLLCGKALRLKDKETGVEYSITSVINLMVAEQKRRARCLNLVDGLFQGPTREAAEEWLMSDWDVEEEKKKTIPMKPCPKEVVDLIRAVKDDRIVDWCITEGYIVPIEALREVEVEKVSFFVKYRKELLSGLAAIISLSTLIVLLAKIVCSLQGPYSGKQEQPLQKPVPRQVQVQGPDTEFINKLLQTSLLPVTTQKGPFTGLAIRGNELLLPAHSEPGDQILIGEENLRVTDTYELVTKTGPTELLVVKVERQAKWRDITKFFPDSICSEKACWLAMNSTLYPRMLFPVGMVTPYGNINLSGKGVSNVMCYGYPTRTGQCGGVVCKAGVIIGMHIGGDGFNGYCAGLKKSFFTESQGQIVAERPARATVHLSTKTSLYPSVFHDIFPGSKEPAALHPRDKRLEVSLDEATFGKYKGNVYKECPELQVAVSHYVSQIEPLLPPNLADPLPLDEVVYGTENLEGLDLNTSAGFPYVTMGVRKKDLIPPKGEPLTKLVAALDLHGYGHPYVTYMKDELRPIEKIRKGKTRLIEASSLNDTIRMKQEYGRLFQVFHKNPGTVTGSAVGCNPDVHWSTFYNEIGEDNIVAFDYSNYDASLSPMWFEALADVLERVGLNPHLIDHVCNSTHIYKNKEYDVVGGMPSGCSGTSIFNSIINNLIIKTLVIRCYKGIDLDKLRIIAYGDDVLCSYPYPLDPALLAAEGAKFGLTMTPADKASEFDGIKKITEVTFLKRSFVPDFQFPFLIHPVFPMNEIHESIRWTRSASTTQEHVRSLCELAWHAGRAVYDEFVQKIRSVPVGRALSLPSYDYLRARWLDSF
nr:polyprotein [Bat sapelovirus]